MSSRPNPFRARLAASSGPLLSDGAMGTLLAANAPDFDQCFDALNLSQPDWVLEVHRAYLAAGADLIQSNTFGANPIKLAQYGLEGRVAEINAAGVRLARQAAQAAGGKALVAGDVGRAGRAWPHLGACSRRRREPPSPSRLAPRPRPGPT
jgi:homocysteine S-methyltransferase